MQPARPPSEPFHLLQISPGGTKNTAFLIVQCSHCHIWFLPHLFSLHCSVLTIVVVDGLKIKTDVGSCQATAGRRQKRCAVTLCTGEGPPDKGRPWNLSCHRHHFENSPFGFRCFRLLTLMSHTWYTVHGGKDMSLLEWKSSLLSLKDCFWLSSEPPHKKIHGYTSSWVQWFLMEILAVINDWVN